MVHFGLVSTPPHKILVTGLIRVTQVGEHISLGIRVSQGGEHISLKIRVSQVGEHISLGIRVSQEGEHISLGYVFPRWGNTYH